MGALKNIKQLKSSPFFMHSQDFHMEASVITKFLYPSILLCTYGKTINKQQSKENKTTYSHQQSVINLFPFRSKRKKKKKKFINCNKAQYCIIYLNMKK